MLILMLKTEIANLTYSIEANHLHTYIMFFYSVIEGKRERGDIERDLFSFAAESRSY